MRKSVADRGGSRASRNTVTVRGGGTRRILVTFFCNIAFAPSLVAQGEGSLPALLGSVRGAGMGGAGAALVGDAGAIFANPAGLATIHHLAVESAYESYPAGNTLSTGALALRVSRFTWGAGAAALGPRYTQADLLGVSSLVFRTGIVALGTSVKYARETIGGARLDAWAGDAGLAVAVFDLMALGVSVQNIGGDLGAGLHLPRRTRAGFTLNYVDPQGTYRLLTTLEGQWPSAGSAFLILGVETGMVTHGLGLLARAGYVGHSAATPASPFTAGAGVELGRLHLDYAYHSDDALGARHRVGFRWTP